MTGLIPHTCFLSRRQICAETQRIPYERVLRVTHSCGVHVQQLVFLSGQLQGVGGDGSLVLWFLGRVLSLVLRKTCTCEHVTSGQYHVITRDATHVTRKTLLLSAPNSASSKFCPSGTTFSQLTFCPISGLDVKIFSHRIPLHLPPIHLSTLSQWSTSCHLEMIFFPRKTG